MAEAREYVLGQSAAAARRLEIQDAHFAEASEKLLDELQLRPGDRVVELGCGAGSFSRRVLRRLGEGGVLVGVDASAGLLDLARKNLSDSNPARFEPVRDDIAAVGPWLDGADAVVARTVLHHVPMAETALGRMLSSLRLGTRLGFIEPDFRTPVANVARLEASGRPELAPLRIWAMAINQLYNANLISPAVGATLAKALEMAGCPNVRCDWSPCRSDHLMLENMWMFYDEVRERLDALELLSAAEVAQQQRLLRELSTEQLPPVWGIFRVTATV